MEFLVLVIVGVAFLVYRLIFGNPSAEKIGRRGEKRVSSVLQSLPEDYILIDDLCFLSGERSVQIDHVVISPYGIFVIETKNYSGWILGGENSEYWTKSVYGRKFRFRNPVKQNFSHLRALSSALNISGRELVPIVVFGEKAELKCRTQSCVINLPLLKYVICSYKDSVLTRERVSEIAEKLCALNITDEQIRNDHVTGVRNYVAKRERLVVDGVCPRCGGKLVVRNGRYGKFRGCENYPHCKFVAEI